MSMTIPELLRVLGWTLIWGVGFFVLSGAVGALVGRLLAGWRESHPAPPLLPVEHGTLHHRDRRIPR
jgi:hypothetical protein